MVRFVKMNLDLEGHITRKPITAGRQKVTITGPEDGRRNAGYGRRDAETRAISDAAASC